MAISINSFVKTLSVKKTLNSKYTSYLDIPVEQELPRDGLLISVAGGLGDQFKKILGGLHLATQLRKTLFAVYDVPQECHFSCILPLFPQVKCLTTEQLRSMFSQDMLPDQELSNFHNTREDTLVVSSKELDSYPIRMPYLYQDRDILIYLQNNLSPSYRTLPQTNSVLSQHKGKALYLLDSTMYLPPEGYPPENFITPYIPTCWTPQEISPHTIAVHARLGNRNPKGTNLNSKIYPGVDLEKLHKTISWLLYKGLLVDIFSDSPEIVKESFGNISGVKICSSGDNPNHLEDILSLASYEKHIDTEVYSGFLHVALCLRHKKSYPYWVSQDF
jgi:hypothetical protein